MDFSVKRGERVAIIGANGTGKTTILKILNGLVEPDAGEIELGSKYRSVIMIRNITYSIWRKQSLKKSPMSILI